MSPSLGNYSIAGKSFDIFYKMHYVDSSVIITIHAGQGYPETALKREFLGNLGETVIDYLPNGILLHSEVYKTLGLYTSDKDKTLRQLGGKPAIYVRYAILYTAQSSTEILPEEESILGGLFTKLYTEVIEDLKKHYHLTPNDQIIISACGNELFNAKSRRRKQSRRLLSMEQLRSEAREVGAADSDDKEQLINNIEGKRNTEDLANHFEKTYAMKKIGKGEDGYIMYTTLADFYKVLGKTLE